MYLHFCWDLDFKLIHIADLSTASHNSYSMLLPHTSTHSSLHTCYTSPVQEPISQMHCASKLKSDVFK